MPMEGPWRQRIATVAGHVLGRWASELLANGSQVLSLMATLRRPTASFANH